MANGSNGAVDRYSEEYFKSLLPPQKEDPTAPAASASATTAPAVDPSSQYFTGPGAKQGLLRMGSMALNQAGIGVAQDATFLPSLAWSGAHSLAPNYIGDVPNWMTSEGVQNELTIPGLTPMNAPERVFAAGAQGAGSMAPFAILARRPDLAVKGFGLGATTQLSREAGAPPWVSQALGAAGGFLLFPGGGAGGAGDLVAREPGAVSGIRAGDVLGTVGTAAGTLLTHDPMIGMAVGAAGKIIGSYGPAALSRLRNMTWPGLGRAALGAGAGWGIGGESTAPPGGAPSIAVPNPLYPQP